MMTREEFIDCVLELAAESTIGDIDTIMAEYDRLTAELAKATEALGFSQSYWMQAIEERDALRAKLEWRPVRVKPDERDKSYLCRIGPSPYCVNIRFFRLTGEWNDDNVIAWMPLPEA